MKVVMGRNRSCVRVLLQVASFLALLPILLLFSSCCEKTDLSNEEILWTAPYKTGDLLIFQSLKSGFDSIRITNKIDKHAEDCNPLEISKYRVHSIIVEYATNRAECDGWQHPKILVSITKDRPDTSFLPKFRVFDIEFAPKYSLRDSLIIEGTQLKIVGKRYDSCYVFKPEINASSLVPQTMAAFYWDKRDGLIKYISTDGEVWELVGRE